MTISQNLNLWTQLSSLEDELGDLTGHQHVAFEGISFDYSRAGLSRTAFSLLQKLAEELAIPAAMQGLFAGDIVNPTEKRAALHPHLRAPQSMVKSLLDDSCANELLQDRDQLFALAERIGKVAEVTDIICLGIGGSSLGLKLLWQALWRYENPKVQVHFVAPVDGPHLQDLCQKLQSTKTLIIVNSKSFTSVEVMMNFQYVSNWLKQTLSEKTAAESIFAVTANVKRAISLGIRPANIAAMSQAIGGRFSLWSSMALPLLLSNTDLYQQLCAGAHAMDMHVLNDSMQTNLAYQSAFIDCWHYVIKKREHRVVLPYCQRLELLIPHLQQLEMESLGKATNLEDQPLSLASCPAVWGQIGSEVEHACGQWLHQHPTRVAVEIIAVNKDPLTPLAHHQQLKRQAIAQSEALWQTNDSGAAYQRIGKTVPSTFVILDEINARTLGALLALYEHKTFILSRLSGVNAFDQWGVEHAKASAVKIQDLAARQMSPVTLKYARKLELD